jgi:NADPH:quinone reductase
MSIPSTMRALQQTSLNGPQDLYLITDAPVPSPGPGEVLIRVTAAGVNFVDISGPRHVRRWPAAAVSGGHRGRR